MLIGIAISTHNRREIANECIAEWDKFIPYNGRLIVVDDASDIPYPNADFRFTQRAGIAMVKNKCLELLDEYDHIFLIDDDIRPLNSMWIGKYVFSNLQHACYIFDRELLWTEPDYKAYNLPRGCLLYFTRRCIDVAGGFDPNFKGYGYEHAELSRRIFNMKLTPAPYIDIPDSKGLFYSHDQELTVRSSVPLNERAKGIKANKIYFEQTQFSNQFIPYK